MARPRNECAHCGYTWFPRGSNRSRKCPNCGVVFDHWESPGGGSTSAGTGCGGVATLLGVGCFGLVVVVGGCIGLAAILGPKGAEREKAKDNSARVEPKGEPQAEPPRAEPPVIIPPSAAPELAPAPRRVYNRPPDGFATDWVRAGAVETRVIGARIATPILLTAKGEDALHSNRVLLIWVETRQVAPATVELRRWIGALSSAATLTGATGQISPVRFSGMSLGNQLDAGVRLVPGATVTDVLAFEVPGPAVQTLTLRLLGSHVGEQMNFEHTIPVEVWNQ